MKIRKAEFDTQYKLARQRLECGAQSADAVCSKLFGLGYELEISGESDAADSVYQQTIDLLEDIKAQPGSSLTDSSIARLAFTHGKSLLHFGKYRAAIAAFRRALEITEYALGNSKNGILLERQGIILGWLGMAQRKASQFDDSIQSYAAAIALWRKLPEMIQAPISPYAGFLGACLLGISKSYRATYCPDEAEEAHAESKELLEKEFDLLKNAH